VPCSSLKHHETKVIPKRVSSSLYLHHFHLRQMREARSHLSARFSPIKVSHNKSVFMVVGV